MKERLNEQPFIDPQQQVALPCSPPPIHDRRYCLSFAPAQDIFKLVEGDMPVCQGSPLPGHDGKTAAPVPQPLQVWEQQAFLDTEAHPGKLVDADNRQIFEQENGRIIFYDDIQAVAR